jgi:hypothetical protein
MSASTADRIFEGTGANLLPARTDLEWRGPVAAAAKLYKGCLAGVLKSDTTTNNPGLVDFVGDGTVAIRGFVHAGCDNTGLAKGARPCHVAQTTGTLVDANAGGANAIGIADLYKMAYGVDNQTCSKMPTDGEPIGQILGIDADTGNPVIGAGPTFLAVARAAAGANFASGIPVCFPVILSLVASGTPVARFSPGVAGYIDRMEEMVVSPAVTTAKLATFTPAISAVSVSGGVLATTSTSLATLGTRAAATTIVGSNRFTAGQEITINPTSVTTYVEGQILLMLFLKAL